MIDVFPGMQAEILRSIFDSGIRGALLKTFGAGNAPTSSDFLEAVKYGTVARGLPICNVTQCNEGAVEQGRYAAGDELRKLVVIGGADMTPEAALVKMQFLLGLGCDSETLVTMMQSNLRGELTQGHN